MILNNYLISLLVVLTLYIILGIIIPYYLMTKKTTVEENQEISNNILRIIMYSFILYPLLSITTLLYSNYMPNHNSEVCTNNGGWIYSCKASPIVGLVTFTIIVLSLLIHNYYCKKEIYKLFKNKGIIKYIITLIYQIISIFVSIILLLKLNGIIISYYYENPIINIINNIVVLMPCTILPISIYKDYFKMKKQ